MNIAELYSTSRNTSNLKSEPRTTKAPSDVLAAAGIAAHKHGTAMLLWGVLYEGKTADKRYLVADLEDMLARRMTREGWKGNARLIAMEVLAWTLHGTCQPCGGRGYSVIQDTPVLSDVLCSKCYGTGKIRLPDTEPHKWLSDQVARLTASAGGAVMQKLAGDMDLG